MSERAGNSPPHNDPSFSSSFSQKNTSGDERDPALRRFEWMVTNALMARQEFFRRFADPRRDIADECGHPKSTYTAHEYQSLYDNDAIANRVVEVFPEECWQVQPYVYEDESSEEETSFEKAWSGLSKTIRSEKSFFGGEEGSPIWEYLYRADKLSGIGQFGILLLGFDDGLPLDQPVAGVDEAAITPIPYYDGSENPVTMTYRSGSRDGDAGAAPASKRLGRPPKRKLLYLRAFPESLIEIPRFEARPDNPRFGQPLSYRVTLNDPRDRSGGIGLSLATVEVHWTRVVHIADCLDSSDTFGKPRMKPVLPRLIDLQKLYGGSAEMYWRGAFPGISFETHPQLGGDAEIDTSAMKDMAENYMNGLQRYLALMGMTAKSLAPQVVDPSPQIERQIEAICIKLGVPKRVFMGSERGELASKQDDSAWNSRLRKRQVVYLTPRVIVPFIDRLINVGVLPKPEEGYCVEWPDLDSQTKLEKADVAFKLSQAIAAYVGGNGEFLVPMREYLIKVFGWTDEEADMAVTQAEEIKKDRQQEDMDKQKTMIEEGLVADPTLKPAGPPGAGNRNPTGKPRATAMGVPGAPGKAGSGYGS